MRARASGMRSTTTTTTTPRGMLPLMVPLLVVLVAFVASLPGSHAWHAAVGPDDAYPLAEGTPAAIVNVAVAAGTAVRLQFAGAGHAAPAVDCAALAQQFHGDYMANPVVGGTSRMLGVMVVDTPAAGRVINWAVSGYTTVPHFQALQGLAPVRGAAFVQPTAQDQNGLCYWARTTLLGAAAPQTCVAAAEPTPSFEYWWSDPVGADTISKVQYKHAAGSNNYMLSTETANVLGSCAGTKLMMMKPAGIVRCMAEVYANTNAATAVTVQHFHGGAGAAQQYRNGDLVPSCSTCQGVIPHIMQGQVTAWLGVNAVGAALPTSVCRAKIVAAHWTDLLPPVQMPMQTARARQLAAQAGFATTNRRRFPGALTPMTCTRVPPAPLVPLPIVRRNSATQLNVAEAPPALVRRRSGSRFKQLRSRSSIDAAVMQP